MWDIVRILVAEGTTVLLTTQYLDEADQLADRISVIDHGKVIAEGTSGELKASVGSGALHVRVGDPAQRPQAERVLTECLGEQVRLESDPAGLTATRGRRRPRGPGAEPRWPRRASSISEFSLGQPSLDEVFLSLTGHPADDEGGNNDGGPTEPAKEEVA